MVMYVREGVAYGPAFTPRVLVGAVNELLGREASCEQSAGAVASAAVRGGEIMITVPEIFGMLQSNLTLDKGTGGICPTTVGK